MKEKQSAQPRDPERQDKLMLLAAALFAVRQFRMQPVDDSSCFGSDDRRRIDEGKQAVRDEMAADATNDAVAILAAVEKVGL